METQSNRRIMPEFMRKLREDSGKLREMLGTEVEKCDMCEVPTMIEKKKGLTYHFCPDCNHYNGEPY